MVEQLAETDPEAHAELLHLRRYNPQGYRKQIKRLLRSGLIQPLGEAPAAKKAPTKKTTVKKAPVKKAPVKKAAPKKTTTKAAAPKKKTSTTKSKPKAAKPKK